MAHDNEQEEIVERHGSDDAQKHRLPTIGQLLVGEEFSRRYDFQRNLNRTHRFYPQKGGHRFGVRGHQEHKITMVNRATAERQAIAGVVGLDQLTIEDPVHRDLIQ